MRDHPIERWLRPDLPREPIFPVIEPPSNLALASLDENEAPADVPAEFKQLVVEAAAACEWNRYVNPSRYREVKARFAAAIGRPPEQVILTAGCDQLVLLVLQAVGGPGRRVRIHEPTYPPYRPLAEITGTAVDTVVLDADYDVSRAPDADAELVILARPNNPTGGVVPYSAVERLLGGPGFVLVDEAYAGYGADTLDELVPAFPNLVLGRSLSKSGLAAVRLGYGVSRPELIEVLERLASAPYHLNPLQLEVASRYERLRPHARLAARACIAERERIEAGLARLGLRAWPSLGNFVLFEIDDAARVHAALLASGVSLRDVSAIAGLGRHLRVTVGAPEQNDRFLTALERAARKR